MTREESPDERVARLREQMPSGEFLQRLYGDLTAIVNELFFLEESKDANDKGVDVPNTLIPTDHLVVVGFQHIADDGRRGGDVRMILRDRGMPFQTAMGLLKAAEIRVEKQLWELTSDVGGD